MKVIIPSKGRSASICTHESLAIASMDWCVLVHNKKEAARYNERVPRNRIVITDTRADTFGLTRQREWACQNLVEPGEWFVFADDNIRQVTGLGHPWRLKRQQPFTIGASMALWHGRYDPPLSSERFQDFLQEDAAEADLVGAHLVGFSTNNNPLFRKKKYRYVGYCSGKLMLWKNDPAFVWDHTISMEDFRNSAEHMLQYGSVLIDSYIWPKAGHYEAGGMGKYEERIEIRKQDVKRLKQIYPRMFRSKNTKGLVPDTDLYVRITTAASLERWRKEMSSGN